MIEYTPVHQFEVRYSAILNFHLVIGKAVSPYIHLADNVNLDHENSHRQRITLYFDDSFTTITVAWDKVFIKSEGGFERLLVDNGIMESVFFPLLESIQAVDNFEKIENVLYYSFKVRILEDSKDAIVREFNSKVFSSYVNELLPEINDSGISLEYHAGESQIHLNLGPYVGIADLTKRNLSLRNPDIASDIRNKLGCILEFKILKNGSNLSFRDYKGFTRQETEYTDKIWQD